MEHEWNILVRTVIGTVTHMHLRTLEAAIAAGSSNSVVMYPGHVALFGGHAAATCECEEQPREPDMGDDPHKQLEIQNAVNA